MAEARSADEPAHLTSHDFTEELVTIGRGAEILGLSLAEMRKLVAGWVE